MALLFVVSTLWNRPQILGPRSENQAGAAVTNRRKAPEHSSPRQQLWHEPGHLAWDLQFSPNDRYLAATIASIVDGKISRNYRVLVIDLKSAGVVLDVPVFFRALTCFSPLSDKVAVFGKKSDRLEIGTRSAVAVYRTVDGKLVREVDLTQSECWHAVTAIGISDDSQNVAAQFSDPGKGRAWELASGEPIEFSQHHYRWSGRRISWTGTREFGGGWPGPGIRIVRSGNGEIVSFCLRDTGPSTEPEFSSDCRTLGATYPDGTFLVWDIRGGEGKPILQRDGFRNCTAFAMSHDLRRLAVAERDGTVHIEPLEIPLLE